MGRLYHGNIEAFSGTNYVVELWQGTTPDSPDTSVELSLTHCTFERQGEGSRAYEDPVRASRVNVGFTAQIVSTGAKNSSVQTNLENIALDEEQKWSIVVKKGGALYWVGRVLADQIQYNRTAEYDFVCEVTAVDALNLIDGYEVDPTWFTSYKITGMELVRQILNKAGLTAHWTNASASDNYIHDAIEHTNAATTLSEKLAFMQFNRYGFIEGFDPFATDVKYMSCKAALEAILTAFGARIIHANGVYWITQINSYDGTSLVYDVYKTDGTLNLADQSISHRITVGSNTRPAWQAKPVISYQQPVREVVANVVRRNGGIEEKETYNTDSISLTGTLRESYPFKVVLNYTTETFTALSVALRMRYLYRVYVYNPTTFNYYWFDVVNGQWQIVSSFSSGAGFSQELQYGGYGEPIGGEYQISKVYPAPPAGATELKVEMYALKETAKSVPFRTGSTSTVSSSLKWSAGVASSSRASFKGTAGFANAYNTSEPWVFEQPITISSSVSSPRNTNSQKVELDILFYNGYVNDVGNVRVKSGSNYINPGLWSVGWTANTGDIGQVLARQMQGLYKDFLPTIRGTMHDAGNYHAARTLYFDSGVWVLNGYRFDVQHETFEGEWIRVQQVFTGVNDNGEGERVQEEIKKLYDTVVKLSDRLNKVASIAGNIGDRWIHDVLVDGDVTIPASDTRYLPQLSYDSTTEEIHFVANPTFSNAWAEIVKTDDESTASDTTLTNDSTLQFSMLANTVYAIRAFIPFDATTATGIKIATTGPATSACVERCDFSHPGGQLEHYLADGLGTQRTNSYSSTGKFAVKYDITLTTTAAGTFAIQWAQANSDAANVTALAGAYLEYKVVKAAPSEFLLLETGDFILLETGDKIILE